MGNETPFFYWPLNTNHINEDCPKCKLKRTNGTGFSCCSRIWELRDHLLHLIPHLVFLKLLVEWKTPLVSMKQCSRSANGVRIKLWKAGDLTQQTFQKKDQNLQKASSHYDSLGFSPWRTKRKVLPLKH